MKLRLTPVFSGDRVDRMRDAHTEQVLDLVISLSQASDEQGIVAVLAHYAESRAVGAWSELFYLDREPAGGRLQFAAGVYGGRADAHADVVQAMLQRWLEQGDPEISLERSTQCTVLLMPLPAREVMQGVLLIGWPPRSNVPEHERHIYRTLQEVVTAAVVRRRGYLAEQLARQELEFLYYASTAINAATTVQEIDQVMTSLATRDDHRLISRQERIREAIFALKSAAIERIELRRVSETARKRAEQYAEDAQRAAALEERNRLARQLHDSVSQALYGIALGAHTARRLLDRDPQMAREPLDYLVSLAEAGLTEMRALIFDLRPDALESEGLISALVKQANSIQTRHGISVTTQFMEEPNVSGRVKEEIYRIVRESLHNAVKHARASEVLLSLQSDGPKLTVEVSDNGVGFDMNDSFPGHMGLRSMWERARRLNADLSITSAPQQGTKITLCLLLTDVGGTN